MIVPRSVSKFFRTTSSAPRSWYSCMQPSSLHIEARDELLISSLSTKKIPGSRRWSSHRVHKSWDAISVAGSRRFSHSLRFAYWGTLTWSCQAHFQHYDAVSRNVRDWECLHSSLENTLLGFDLCFTPVSWWFPTQISKSSCRSAGTPEKFMMFNKRRR